MIGATIDVADAYRQITLSYEAALHRWVMIYIGDNNISLGLGLGLGLGLVVIVNFLKLLKLSTLKLFVLNEI